MAVQNINIGNIANDGTGDNLREAFAKVNANFSDLDNRAGNNQTVENLGTGTGIFYTKENNILYFKSLVAGDNVSFSATNDEITVTNTDNFTVQTDSDSVNISGTGKFFGLKGSSNINTALAGNNVSITIDGDGLVALDPAPTLSGDLNVNNNNITNATSITASTFVGNLVGTVNGIEVTDLASNLDFGEIIPNVTSLSGLIVATTDIDYGTFLVSGAIDSDFGSF